ncbi:MAG TPA: hypothetical protein VGF25_23670 [Thermoleophilaceae bacterium]|jgi:hypothetical protein
MEQGEQRGFLPPEPPGPEPDLGAPPPAPPPPQAQPAAQQPYQQPAYPPQYQQQQPPPPPGYGWQQQQPPPPPPGYGWQPPPPGYPAAPGWAYPKEPDNGSAVAGFVLAMVSIGLWLFTFGLSSIVSIACAVAGLIYSIRGKRRVREGETRKHKGLAQAGFISSIIMLVLATLSTAAWAFFWIKYATDEDFRNDVDGDSGSGGGSGDDFFNDSSGITSALRIGIPLVRGVIRLLS